LKILKFDDEEIKMEKDPVCGMEVDPQTAAGKSEYKGQPYYFCSPGCKTSFDKDPGKYLSSHHGHDAHHH
jgi:Cu+-exporting ATPase